MDLNKLAKDIITIVEQCALDAGVNLKYDKVAGKVMYPYVYGSPLHLRQLFLNIYANCIKYNKTGGMVSTWSRNECTFVKAFTDGCCGWYNCRVL